VSQIYWLLFITLVLISFIPLVKQTTKASSKNDIFHSIESKLQNEYLSSLSSSATTTATSSSSISSPVVCRNKRKFERFVSICKNDIANAEGANKDAITKLFSRSTIVKIFNDNHISDVFGNKSRRVKKVEGSSTKTHDSTQRNENNDEYAFIMYLCYQFDVNICDVIGNRGRFYDTQYVFYHLERYSSGLFLSELARSVIAMDQKIMPWNSSWMTVFKTKLSVLWSKPRDIKILNVNIEPNSYGFADQERVQLQSMRHRSTAAQSSSSSSSSSSGPRRFTFTEMDDNFSGDSYSPSREDDHYSPTSPSYSPGRPDSPSYSGTTPTQFKDGANKLDLYCGTSSDEDEDEDEFAQMTSHSLQSVVQTYATSTQNVTELSSTIKSITNHLTSIQSHLDTKQAEPSSELNFSFND